MRAVLFLVIAGFLDAALTQLGISSGNITEGNPAVKLVIEKGWFLFYTVKISLPLLLFGIVLFRPLKVWVKWLMNTCCIVYLAVLGIHFAWVLFYLKSIA